MTYAMIGTWRMAFEGIQKAMADLKMVGKVRMQLKPLSKKWKITPSLNRSVTVVCQMRKA